MYEGKHTYLGRYENGQWHDEKRGQKNDETFLILVKKIQHLHFVNIQQVFQSTAAVEADVLNCSCSRNQCPVAECHHKVERSRQMLNFTHGKIRSMREELEK